MEEITQVQGTLTAVDMAVASSDIKETMIDSESNSASPSTREDEQAFSLTAAVVGSLLGCIVAASNMYLGLKVGWTFGASLFGAVLSFAILKPLTQILGHGYFGPSQNCQAQTSASTTGGLSVGFITAIPALYRLGLMSETVDPDIVALTLWSISAAFYGLFFGIPLQKYFVVKQDLPFPTPRATAYTILALHESSNGQKHARRQAKLIALAFVMSIAVTIASHWIYILDKIHLLYWIGRAVGSLALQKADTLWGWQLQPNLAFFGAGIIIPTSTAVSFFIGSIIAFGAAGSPMVASGYLVGPYGFGKAGNGSAQSWFIWSGISLMLFSTLAELILQYRSLYRAFTDAVIVIRNVALKAVKGKVPVKQQQSQEDDYVLMNQQIPTWWWVTGLVLSIIATCCVLGLYFDIPVHHSLLAVFLAFVLSVIALQAYSTVDINPVSTMGKCVQLIFSQISYPTVFALQRANLICAGVTAAAAAQSVDMVGDLKTAHLIGASPRAQFHAQMVGSLFAVAVSVPLFVLYTRAYPCIIHESDICEFALAPALGWQNVTKILTTNAVIPHGSLVCAVVLGAASFIITGLREALSCYGYSTWWMPNLSAVGIGFITPSPSISTAMLLGHILAGVWQHFRPKHAEYRTSIAAGWIGGVGIAGIVKAALQLGGVAGQTVKFNCPLDDTGIVKCL